MKLKEYEGKNIFQKNNIIIPKGFVVSSIEEIDNLLDLPSDIVVKSQILVGGRGKSGGIKFATKDNVKEVCSELLGSKIKDTLVDELLIEEKLNIEKEIYVALTIDRAAKSIKLLLSLEGGVEIEELSLSMPEKIFKTDINSLDRDLLDNFLGEFNYNDKLIEIIGSMKNIMINLDAELVEINPLVIHNNMLVAADSKIILDDNALYRHLEFKKGKKSQLTDIEKKADDNGLQYVELDGDVGVIGNGAGLVMATLDVLKYFNLNAANFLDVGGGASVDVMEKALEIVLIKNGLKAVIINIFGGITKCDEIALGIVNYKQKNSLDIPVVIRMIGTNEGKAKQILNENNILTEDSMEEAAKKVNEIVNKGVK